MINIPPIPLLPLIYLFLVRLIGFIIYIVVLAKAIRELRADPKRVPRTKRLLVVLFAVLVLSSTIPLFQTGCYITQVCNDIIAYTVVPSTLAGGTNSIITALIFWLLYFTKEKGYKKKS